MKRVALVVAMLLVLVAPVVAQAAIVMDFDPDTFVVDNGPGDFAHTYTTAEGTVSFNGRIYNKLDGDTYPDHTTGQTYFLKNTGAEELVTLSFDFDVYGVEFWWLATDGTQMWGEILGATGEVLAENEGDDEGTGLWENVRGLIFSEPVSSIRFWADGGNNMAIDDFTLLTARDMDGQQTIPEPASMALMLSGLLGVLGIRRKK